MNSTSMYQISLDMDELTKRLNDPESYNEDGELNEDIKNLFTLKSEELKNKAIDYAYVIKEYKNQEDLITLEMKRLAALKDKAIKKQDFLSSILKDAMINFNMEKIETATLSVKLTNSKSVEILNEEELDKRFINIVTTMKPDKKAIKQAIDNGEVVKGAILSENKNLRIS